MRVNWEWAVGYICVWQGSGSVVEKAGHAVMYKVPLAHPIECFFPPSCSQNSRATATSYQLSCDHHSSPCWLFPRGDGSSQQQLCTPSYQQRRPDSSKRASPWMTGSTTTTQSGKLRSAWKVIYHHVRWILAMPPDPAHSRTVRASSSIRAAKTNTERAIPVTASMWYIIQSS